MADGVSPTDAEACGARRATVVRFSELEPLKKHPADTRLERYRRERFSVIGRANERAPGAAGAAVGADVNFGYMKCAPGKGNCSHHHPQWEIFIPLTGRWRLVIEGGELEGRQTLELGRWDMIIVPPETFHEATNISDEDGWLMSINPGVKGAPYTIHPEVIEALRQLSENVGEAAREGVDV
jgi:mannose-6-phosphate isomerase-like protein (cupin superfamily)